MNATNLVLKNELYVLPALKKLHPLIPTLANFNFNKITRNELFSFAITNHWLLLAVTTYYSCFLTHALVAYVAIAM